MDIYADTVAPGSCCVRDRAHPGRFRSTIGECATPRPQESSLWLSFKILSLRSWQHDFAALANPHVVSVVYGHVRHAILENGLLPVSFLPGDSSLLLAGALIRDVSIFADNWHFTTAASLGCWLSYIQ